MAVALKEAPQRQNMEHLVRNLGLLLAYCPLLDPLPPKGVVPYDSLNLILTIS